MRELGSGTMQRVVDGTAGVGGDFRKIGCRSVQRINRFSLEMAKVKCLQLNVYIRSSEMGELNRAKGSAVRVVSILNQLGR